MTKRAAITMPDDLYVRMERDRRRRKVPRSRWIQEAVGDYLKRRDEAQAVEEYFAAYRRIPDGTDEVFIAIERAGIEDLRKSGLD